MAEFDQELETANDTVEEVDSAESDPSTSAVAPATRQPAKKVNLDEFEDFRKFKSKSQSELQQERNARIRTEQTLAQMQQQLAQYEQYATANMTPEERYQHEVAQAQARATAAEQRAFALENDRLRETALKQISEKYRVPLEALEPATDAAHARDLAWEWREQQVELQAAESPEAKAKREQKRAANRPDLGGGSPSPIPTEAEKKWEQARKQKDTKSLFSLGLQTKE